MLYTVLALAVCFAFLNGFHDSASLVAVVISSRAMRPRVALLWTALGEFIGPFLFGVAVAKTLGADLLNPQGLTLEALAAGLTGAILWNLLTWWLAIPSSSSHALVGGLLGPTLLLQGMMGISWEGLKKVLIALFLSPILGFLAGYLLMRFWFWALQNATPRINLFFRRGQTLTSFLLALTHGSNDGQKSMGVMVLALMLAGRLSTFQVPLWVVVACAGAIALGVGLGAWRLIRTLGGRIFRIRAVHGFTSQTAGGAVIGLAAWLGGPVSTTHVLNSAIMGAGAAERLTKVRWGVVRDMVVAWVLTIPISALMAIAAYWALISLQQRFGFPMG